MSPRDLAWAFLPALALAAALVALERFYSRYLARHSL